MKTSDFDYELPDELIAHYPIESRSSSRLLVGLNEIEHRIFQIYQIIFMKEIYLLIIILQ